MVRLLITVNAYLVQLVSFSMLFAAYPLASRFVIGLLVLVVIAWVVAFILQAQLSRYLRMDLATYRTIHTAIAISLLIAGGLQWLIL